MNTKNLFHFNSIGYHTFILKIYIKSILIIFTMLHYLPSFYLVYILMDKHITQPNKIYIIVYCDEAIKN